MIYSPYASVEAEIYGKLYAPNDVTNFNMVAQGDKAYLSWTTVTDLDVLIGGSYWIRHTSKISGVTWAGSTDVTKTVPGNMDNYLAPLLSGSYLIKALDSSGNESQNTAFIQSNTADILALNVVHTSNQHTLFGSNTADKGVNDSRNSNIFYDSSDNTIELASASLGTGTHDAYYATGTGFITEDWCDSAAGNWDARSGSMDDSSHINNDLEDDNASFISEYIGATVRNTTDSTTATVVSVTSGTRMTLSANIFTGTEGDAYRIEVANNMMRDTGATFVAGTHDNRIIRNTDTALVSTVSSINAYNDLILVDNIFGQTDQANYKIEGDIPALGYYYFTDQALDLGAIYTSRITGSLSSTGVSVKDLFDMATGNFDSNSGLFDGTDISDTNAVLEIRTTQDDPAVSPTWGSWTPFFIGDYFARGLEFRTKLTSSNTSHNVQLDALTVTVDMPDQIKRNAGVTSSSGTNNGTEVITYATPYKIVPTVGITLQNANTGDYWTISSSTASGFTVTFYNSSATATQKTFNWISSGY
jgi:hypothetical protein